MFFHLSKSVCVPYVIIHNSHINSIEFNFHPTKKELHSTKRKYSSDSSVWFTGIETSNDNCADDEVNAKRHKKVMAAKCQRFNMH